MTARISADLGLRAVPEKARRSSCAVTRNELLTANLHPNQTYPQNFFDEKSKIIVVFANFGTIFAENTQGRETQDFETKKTLVEREYTFNNICSSGSCSNTNFSRSIFDECCGIYNSFKTPK